MWLLPAQSKKKYHALYNCGDVDVTNDQYQELNHFPHLQIINKRPGVSWFVSHSKLINQGRNYKWVAVRSLSMFGCWWLEDLQTGWGEFKSVQEHQVNSHGRVLPGADPWGNASHVNFKSCQQGCAWGCGVASAHVQCQRICQCFLVQRRSENSTPAPPVFAWVCVTTRLPFACASRPDYPEFPCAWGLICPEGNTCARAFPWALQVPKEAVWFSLESSRPTWVSKMCSSASFNSKCKQHFNIYTKVSIPFTFALKMPYRSILTGALVGSHLLPHCPSSAPLQVHSSQTEIPRNTQIFMYVTFHQNGSSPLWVGLFLTTQQV